MNEPLEDIFRTSSESEEEMNLAVKSWWEEQGEQAPQLLLEYLMNGAITKRWSKTPKLAYQVFITTSKRARKIDQLPVLNDGKILSKWERTMTYLVRSIVFKRKGVESEEITTKELSKCMDSINDWENKYREWDKKVDITGEWKKTITTAMKKLEQLEDQQQQIQRKAAKEAKKKQAEGLASNGNETSIGFLSTLMGGGGGGGGGSSEGIRGLASSEGMNGYGSFGGRYGPSPSSAYGFPNSLSSPLLLLNHRQLTTAASSQPPPHTLSASGMSSSERRSAEWVGSPPPTRTTSPYVSEDMKCYASNVLLTQLSKAMGSPSGTPPPPPPPHSNIHVNTLTNSQIYTHSCIYKHIEMYIHTPCILMSTALPQNITASTSTNTPTTTTFFLPISTLLPHHSTYLYDVMVTMNG